VPGRFDCHGTLEGVLDTHPGAASSAPRPYVIGSVTGS
jgi:hypothetical protein